MIMGVMTSPQGILAPASTTKNVVTGGGQTGANLGSGGGAASPGAPIPGSTQAIAPVAPVTGVAPMGGGGTTRPRTGQPASVQARFTGRLPAYVSATLRT